MSFGIDFPVISGGTLYNSIDAYGANGISTVSANPANGAYNTPGALYSYQPSTTSTTANGVGSTRFAKYVRYNPTNSVAIPTGPAPVYWKDEAMITVTPTLAEALGGNANAFAGWLMYNTTTTAAAAAATINGNWCFIHVGGFLPGAVAPAATAAGDIIIGAAGAFTPARVAAGTAPTNVVAGVARSAVANGLADIWVPLLA